MCLVVARAAIQSATLDEASSYLGYCALDWPSHWYPTSGNHVLNSIVCRLFNTIFGLSHLTFRSGALLGAAFYLFAAYRLCAALIEAKWLRWPVWICLTLNPFVLDYLVAARGYSMALGFLMVSLLASARVLSGHKPIQNCAFASICVALSFTASFPFAFVDLAIIILLWTWCVVHYPHRWPGFSAACFIPGTVTAFAIAGSVVLNWPRGQLYYGAHNIKEMWHSLVTSSLFELNPYVVHSVMLPGLAAIGHWLPKAFYAVAILLVCAIAARSYGELSNDARLARFVKYLVWVLSLSFLLYWLAHRFFHLLYPMERTGIFFVVLATLWFGMAAALRPISPLGSAVRFAATAVLYAGAFYFAGCLRLTYFKEWRFDADVKTAFEVALNEERKSGTHQLVASWEYADSLKFYELYYKHTPPFLFSDMTDNPFPIKAIYVLNFPGYHDYIEKQKFKIVYRAHPSDIVVAIRP